MMTKILDNAWVSAKSLLPKHWRSAYVLYLVVGYLMLFLHWHKITLALLGPLSNLPVSNEVAHALRTSVTVSLVLSPLISPLFSAFLYSLWMLLTGIFKRDWPSFGPIYSAAVWSLYPQLAVAQTLKIMLTFFTPLPFETSLAALAPHRRSIMYTFLIVIDPFLIWSCYAVIDLYSKIVDRPKKDVLIAGVAPLLVPATIIVVSLFN